ncbi:hypothetical protein GCM10010518_20580 [Kitasatospora cinereorecta]
MKPTVALPVVHAGPEPETESAPETLSPAVHGHAAGHTRQAPMTHDVRAVEAAPTLSRCTAQPSDSSR